ncbi:MAG TPA: sterol desaturase family protein [Gemmatimonadales bacterium]|nr:sterol desaturase family protein [Gemmatimonadales bacterium]
MMPEAMRRDEEPVRLFRSGLLEWFTHVHPAVVPVLWLPVAGYFLVQGAGRLPGLTVVLAAGMGLVVWSLAEYLIHRFVFHFSPRTSSAWLARLLYLSHGVHHAQPWDKTRLVMPPAASIPLAVAFYWAFRGVIGQLLGAPSWVAPVFGGFLIGYVGYDMLHYATHHLPMKWGPLRWIKRHHMLHHYSTPDARYGVSTPTWDVVLGTMPESVGSATQRASAEKR